MNENGDPIRSGTERSMDGRKTTRRRRLSNLLLPIFLLALTATVAYNTLQIHAISGAAPFGTSQLFSIVATYSFGNPGASTSTFVAGSNATVSLSVVNNAPISHTIAISFNASNPTDWNAANTNAGAGPITTNGLSMSYNGLVFAPFDFSGCASGNYYCSANVIVNPGTNTIKVMLAASATSPLSTFSIQWYAQSIS